MRGSELLNSDSNASASFSFLIPMRGSEYEIRLTLTDAARAFLIPMRGSEVLSAGV